MLGSHGQKLCNNLEAYWITQTCDVDKDTTSKYMVEYGGIDGVLS